MRLAGSIVLIFTALVPLAAGAVDLKLGIKGEAGYDSNVGRSTNRKGDFSFRFSPEISFAMQDAKFGASLRYVPTYEAFVTFTELNDLTHYLTNHFSYAASDKTKLSLHNRFRIRNVLNFGEDEFIDGTPPSVPDNDIGRDRILTFGSSFNLSHSFTPRLSGSTDVAYTLFETERQNSSDSYSVSAFQSFNYAINAANRVGAGGGGVLQRFEGATTIPGSESYVFRAWGSYVRKFGERTTLSIRMGPAVITNNQDSGRGFSAPRYPHTAVDEEGITLGDLRDQFRDDSIGESQGLASSEPIPPGSVIVPNASTCTGLNPPGPVLFGGEGCASRYVLRLGKEDAGPSTDWIIGKIKSEPQQVEILGSSSGSEGTKVTVFGDVTLSHIWMPNLVSTARYNRSQSTASGQGAGTIADSLSFLTSWRPTPLWNLSFRASYVKRQTPNKLSRTFLYVEPDPLDPIDPDAASIFLVALDGNASLVEVSDSIDTQRWGVALRAARRITRHMTASLRADWSDQTSRNSSRSPNNFGVFTVFMGIKYDFDPLRF